MKKKVYSNLLMVLLAGISFLSMRGADIRMQKVVFEDYIPILEAAGYYAYSFDIKSLNDKQYNLIFSCREYQVDSIVRESISPYKRSYENMTLVSEFPEDSRKNITDEEMYDSTRGIYTCAEKIVVGTYPKNESTTILMVDLNNISTFSLPLELKPLTSPLDGEVTYIYVPRPFKVGEIKLDTFIPLVFYGSAWVDKEYGFIRSCGEDELSPDMSDDIIKNVPHSYVMGVTVKSTE